MSDNFSLSIIIPTLNESSAILTRLSELQDHTIEYSARVEIIVADGGSDDDTAEQAKRFAPSSDILRVRVVESPRGRAVQMNHGAASAHGEVLLFLHADCQLPKAAFLRLWQSIEAGEAAGSFHHRIADDRWVFRWIEWGDRFRQRWLRMPYGDQGIFVRRQLFQDVGGYPEVPLMEDVRLVRKLRRQVRMAVIPEPLISDARRWQRRGVLRQFLLNQYLIIAERIGVSPERLARLYRT